MQSKDAEERIRVGRIFEVTCGSVTLICKRPTDVQVRVIYAAASEGKLNDETVIPLLTQYIVGWRDVRMCDLFKDEQSTELVEFSKTLIEEWLSDHAEYWDGIFDKMVAVFREFKGTAEAAEKN